MQYMRAHGSMPGPTQRPVAAGSVTGALAALPAVGLLWFSEAIESMSQTLGMSWWLTLLLQVGVMACAGAFYGWLFSRAANDRRGGWLFGISYGFLIWMLGPVTMLQWIVSHPLAVGRAAMGLLGGHLAFGLALGLLFPFIHELLQSSLRHGSGRENEVM